MDIRLVIKQQPILAILRGIPTKYLLNYAETIIEGGIRFFEVAMNSETAAEQIGMLKQEFKDQIMVGAGTAITTERAQTAVEAGAQFLLSPSADEAVLSWCMNHNITLLPGALTPSDVTKCLGYGFDTIKLFPAGAVPKGYINSLKGPLHETEYIAIGGVAPDNVISFLRQGYIGVGLGSNILPADIMESRDWNRGKSYVASMVKQVKEMNGEMEVL